VEAACFLFLSSLIFYFEHLRVATHRQWRYSRRLCELHLMLQIRIIHWVFSMMLKVIGRGHLTSI
jgi:hypothetical protein